MLYLKIENPGLTSVEALLVLGVSTTRYNSNARTAGEFGTGAKNGVACLLRHDIEVTIFTGLTRVSYYAKPETVKDDFIAHTFHRVVAKISGKDSEGRSCNRKEKTGFTTELGLKDWNTPDMALREFVANAVDRSARQFGADEYMQHVKIEVVEDNQVRAKEGCTRVFLPLQGPVREFYETLNKRFLQFGEPENLDKAILPKSDRNFVDGRPVPAIYKNGIFVREACVEIPGRHNEYMPSVFDYNLPNLRLDDCRRVDDYAVRAEIARVLGRAEPDQLATIFKRLAGEEPASCFEGTVEIDPWDYGHEEKANKIFPNWQSAWKLAFGDGVLVAHQSLAELIERKGYRPILFLNKNWSRFADLAGIPNDITILGKDAREGKTVMDPTPDVVNERDLIWQFLEENSLTQEKQKPDTKCFNEVMDGGQYRHGYYRDDTCFIHQEISTDSERLTQAMLEETSHFVTGSTDLCRDFQDYAFRVAAIAIRQLRELKQQKAAA